MAAVPGSLLPLRGQLREGTTPYHTRSPTNSVCNANQKAVLFFSLHYAVRCMLLCNEDDIKYLPNTTMALPDLSLARELPAT